VCRPADRPAGDDDASFLHRIPLRTLLRHLMGRLGTKAISPARA
jgi:hypothetical protein